MLFVGENKVKPVGELREFQQKHGIGMQVVLLEFHYGVNTADFGSHLRTVLI